MTSKLQENFRVDLNFDGDLSASPTGDIAQISGLANLKQAILNRIATTRGSLVHRPDYGIGLGQFEGRLALRETTQELLIKIVEQFRREPRVEEILGLDIVSSGVDGEFIIRLNYRPAGLREQVTEFNILSGEILT